MSDMQISEPISALGLHEPPYGSIYAIPPSVRAHSSLLGKQYGIDQAAYCPTFPGGPANSYWNSLNHVQKDPSQHQNNMLQHALLTCKIPYKPF
jgi:hypothetical protein